MDAMTIIQCVIDERFMSCGLSWSWAYRKKQFGGILVDSGRREMRYQFKSARLVNAGWKAAGWNMMGRIGLPRMNVNLTLIMVPTTTRPIDRSDDMHGYGFIILRTAS